MSSTGVRWKQLVGWSAAAVIVAGGVSAGYQSYSANTALSAPDGLRVCYEHHWDYFCTGLVRKRIGSEATRIVREFKEQVEVAVEECPPRVFVDHYGQEPEEVIDACMDAVFSVRHAAR